MKKLRLKKKMEKKEKRDDKWPWISCVVFLINKLLIKHQNSLINAFLFLRTGFFLFFIFFFTIMCIFPDYSKKGKNEWGNPFLGDDYYWKLVWASATCTFHHLSRWTLRLTHFSSLLSLKPLPSEWVFLLHHFIWY